MGEIDYVLSPFEYAGTVLGYETARRTGCQHLQAYRSSGSPTMVLEPGMQIPTDARVLLIDDCITSGSTFRQMRGLVHEHKAQPVGLVTLLSRYEAATGRALTQQEVGMPCRYLLRVSAEIFNTSGGLDQCPMCRDGLPARQNPHL
jgi:orotate phosphoribosyltransferase